MAPRVIYWNNIPSPYMVERFDAIAARGGLEFSAWFDAERFSDRSWDVVPASWQFPAAYLPPNPGKRLLHVTRELRRQRPDVLVTLYGTPTFAAGVMAAKMLGVRVILRGLKTFESWRPRGNVREFAKQAIFRQVDAIHVTGPDAAEYMISCGANPDHIFSFPEPVDVEHYAHGARIARLTAAQTRDTLGLHGCVFVYVGRLWQGKGLDYLVEAYRQTLASGCDASLVLIGDGSDEDRYRAMTAGLPNVLFPGFIQKPELPKWLGVADVLVFPTLGDPYGHVVQEAMAASLPVIATESAGDIYGRIVDGETGYVVPPADTAALQERMQALAENPVLRAEMGRRGYEVIAPRTVEWWASEFENMILSLCEGSRAKKRSVAA